MTHREAGAATWEVLPQQVPATVPLVSQDVEVYRPPQANRADRVSVSIPRAAGVRIAAITSTVLAIGVLACLPLFAVNPLLACWLLIQPAFAIGVAARSARLTIDAEGMVFEWQAKWIPTRTHVVWSQIDAIWIEELPYGDIDHRHTEVFLSVRRLDGRISQRMLGDDIDASAVVAALRRYSPVP